MKPSVWYLENSDPAEVKYYSENWDYVKQVLPPPYLLHVLL